MFLLDSSPGSSPDFGRSSTRATQRSRMQRPKPARSPPETTARSSFTTPAVTSSLASRIASPDSRRPTVLPTAEPIQPARVRPAHRALRYRFTTCRLISCSGSQTPTSSVQDLSRWISPRFRDSAGSCVQPLIARPARGAPSDNVVCSRPLRRARRGEPVPQDHPNGACRRTG